MEIGNDIFSQSYSGIESRLQKVIDAYNKIKKNQPESIHHFKRDKTILRV